MGSSLPVRVETTRPEVKTGSGTAPEAASASASATVSSALYVSALMYLIALSKMVSLTHGALRSASPRRVCGSVRAAERNSNACTLKLLISSEASIPKNSFG